MQADLYVNHAKSGGTLEFKQPAVGSINWGNTIVLGFSNGNREMVMQLTREEAERLARDIKHALHPVPPSPLTRNGNPL
jgi:hypothetical protein